MGEDMREQTVVADGMRIDWDVPIPMDDGIVLRADLYRPIADGRYPVIMSYGPYGKNMPFQIIYADQWRAMIREHPDIATGSTCKYQSWEVVDPEKWVPDGYICVRVDSRGAGRSPGVLDIFSPREAKDFYHCIEWAGIQSWSNGKIGLLGISYYAVNQWHVAALQPPHLAACCVWEGFADYYRDCCRHGGILNTFLGGWFKTQIIPVQHGYGGRGDYDPNNDMLTAGPATLSELELTMNRISPPIQGRRHPLDDRFYRERSPEWSRVRVPLLSCGSWGGQGLHLRGNVEGFVNAASERKWLEVHGLEHWTHFYTDYGVGLQKRFFDHFLKGVDNGWDKEPRVLLNIRHPGENFVLRKEHEWPLMRTQWTKLYLDPAERSLSPKPLARESTLAYTPLTSDGVSFSMTFDRATEITGPAAAKIFMSSQSIDADLFLVVQLFDPHGREVTFKGSVEPAMPITQGWLRASHRKLDPKRTLEFRPYHTHDEEQPLEPGKVYELDVEIWPTCIVIPAGYRLTFTIQGRDFERPTVSGQLATLGVFRGSGPFLHVDPWDRRPERVGGEVTVYGGGAKPSYLLLPVIPNE
jgi:predicted acyl esterase